MTELRRLIVARNEIDTAIAGQVAALRTAGFSWSAIGAEMGCSKQAAQQRYGGAL